MPRFNRRQSPPVLPHFQFRGNKSLAGTYKAVGSQFLSHMNNVFGGNKSFSRWTRLKDGTTIQAVKHGKLYYVAITAPFFGSDVIEDICSLNLILVPRYDHTQGFTIHPFNNYSSSTGQNRGVLGHYSIGDLPRAISPIPSLKFKDKIEDTLGVSDRSLSTLYDQNISNEVSRYFSLVNGVDNDADYWTQKEQIQLTYNTPPITYTSQTGDPDEDQVAEISERLSDLRDLEVGNIDWRGLDGKIYTMKGPSGRGIPCTMNSVTNENSASSEVKLERHLAENTLFLRSNRADGASRIDCFGNFIYQNGEAFAALPVGHILFGFGIFKTFNTTTEEVDEYIIAAHADESVLEPPTSDSDNSPLATIRFSSLLIDTETDLLSGDNWNFIRVILDYNINYPIFFSSSCKKAISTYMDFRADTSVSVAPNTRNFESYSTLRATIVDEDTITTTVSQEPVVNFPAARTLTGDPISRELYVSKTEFPGNNWESYYKYEIRIEEISEVPESEVIYRITSDFKYGTELEVYIEKRFSMESSFARLNHLLSTPQRIVSHTSEPPDPDGVISTDTLSDSFTFTISYYQSFVGEFEVDNTLTTLTDPSQGIELDPQNIAPSPSTGTGTLQKIGEVVSEYSTSSVGSVGSVGTIVNAKMQAVCCDLRFGLAIYNITSYNFTPYATSIPPNSLLSLSNADFKGYTVCPGRFVEELPDIDSTIISGGVSSQAFHIGNNSYFNDITNSTRFLSNKKTDPGTLTGHFDRKGSGDSSLESILTFDYATLGYVHPTSTIVSYVEYDTSVPVLNPLFIDLDSSFSSVLKSRFPSLWGSSVRLDICGLYSQGQQLEYTILGIDKNQYFLSTPWVEHLPGYDFDEDNDTLDPPGPKTVTSDFWDALGDPRFIEPIQEDKDLLNLDGDFMLEENYKNLSIYRGITSSSNNRCMSFYEDTQPPENLIP